MLFISIIKISAALVPKLAYKYHAAMTLQVCPTHESN